MAKTLLNSALAKISGRVDNWVYRRQNGKLVISKRPDFSETVPTVAQLTLRERFSKAAAYGRQAMADPLLRARYAESVAGESNAFAAAVTDWFKPPTVAALDVSGYHGEIGDPIVIHASDDFEVAGVSVTIRDAANAVLEQGPAALAAGGWTYPAATLIAAGQSITIEAVATDRPGHTGTKTTPLVVA